MLSLVEPAIRWLVWRTGVGLFESDIYLRWWSPKSGHDLLEEQLNENEVTFSAYVYIDGVICGRARS